MRKPAHGFAPRHLAWLVALACTGAVPVRAQQVAMAAGAAAAPTLKAIVVSGSRAEQDRDDVPASMDVITREQLEAGQVHDIRDLVNDLPNVSVKRAPARFTLAQANTGRDGNAGFNIRGMDGNRVLLLVDGIRVPNSYVFNATAFGRDYFSMDLMERVEILRGSASALYGSDGIGGLVNFITLEPSAFLGANKTLGGRAGISYSGDDKGTSAFGAIAGKASDSLQWLLTINAGHASGLTNQGTVDATNTTRTTPNPEQDRSNSLLGKLVYQPDATQKQVLTLEHVDKHSEVQLLSARALPPLAGTSTVDANGFNTLARNRLTWDARFALNTALADNLHTVLSHQKSDSREYTAETRSTAAARVRDTTYNEATWQANAVADKLLRGPVWSQKITYGLDTMRRDITTLQNGLTPAVGETFPLKRFPDTTESSTALFVQDEFISDAWSITPGVRVDQFKLQADQAGFSPPSSTPAASLSGTATSPKLGVLLRATPQWSLFGNYAAGFKAPNANQVNAFFENLTQFYKTIPNPNLKPEKSQNFELGVRGRFDALTVDVAAFSGYFTDFIEDSKQVGGGGVPGNPTIFQSVNVGKVRISGFEVKGEVVWSRSASSTLSMPVAYGQAHGTDENTGQPVNAIDPAKLNVGLRYATPGWDVRLDLAHHAGKPAGDIDSASLVAPPATQFTVPSATTLDLGGQWRIHKGLRLNVALVNLTDQKYWNWSDVRGLSNSAGVVDAYTQPGRHLNLSLVADF